MKYLILNLLVTIFVVGFCIACFGKSTLQRRTLFVILILLLLTAVFDSLIIKNGIVGYNVQHILGIYVGKAPIEDFFYAVVAALLVTVLWDYYEQKN